MGFGRACGGTDQTGQFFAFVEGDADCGKPSGRSSEVFGDENFALVGESAFDRTTAERTYPIPGVNDVDHPFRIDANSLQVREESPFGGPEAVERVLAERAAQPEARR